jgi:signal transduction histidine kinase
VSLRPSEPSIDILVVEDTPDLAQALVEALQECGMQAEAASNGKEAFERLANRAELPDVILLDLRMPVMDGWQFRVRQREDPILSRIPVIAITADRSPQAEAIDCDALLRKPTDLHRLVQTIRDVAEKSRLDELLRKHQLIAIGQLASGFAHELANPLAYIVENLRFIQEHLSGKSPVPLEPGEMSEVVKETQQGAQRISQIVRDMQTFSSIRSEKAEPTDLRTIMDSVLNLAEPALKRRANVSRKYDEPVVVNAPPARLAQVFLHLVLNAAEAMVDAGTPSHNLTVTLSMEPSAAIVEIVDDAGGIPSSRLERIFDPFLSTKDARGSGMGLYVCHRIVSDLNGLLTVKSAPGAGSTFRVQLPLAS